jgi:hypothetical protein
MSLKRLEALTHHARSLCSHRSAQAFEMLLKTFCCRARAKPLASARHFAKVSMNRPLASIILFALPALINAADRVPPAEGWMISQIISTPPAPAASIVPGIQLIRSETRHIERQQNWDDGVKQDTFELHTDQPYAYCKHEVVIGSRNPNNDPVSTGYAGFRLVSWTAQRMRWQWWVMSSGQFFNRVRYWLIADFTVTWIHKDATAQDRVKNGCMDPPPVEEVRSWPTAGATTGTSGTPGGVGLPTTSFWTILRSHCRSKSGRPTTSTIDSDTISKVSCDDARSTLLDLANKRDVCTAFDSNEFVGHTTWISTRSCP